MRGKRWWRHVGVLGLSALGAGTLDSQSGPPRPTDPLPFRVGEELVYRVRLGPLGGGRGTLRIEGPEAVRGEETWVLAFQFRTRFALAVVEHQSRSWLDPDRLTSLGYQARERTPLGSHRDSVAIYPAERRWESGVSQGSTPCDTPLDELSFIYYLRTLPLRDGVIHSLPHHYDPRRNPVVVRVVRREVITVPAGDFATVVVDMQVNDPRRFGARGLIRFFLTDDAHRLPVRIESSVPVAGATVFSLESWREGGE